MERYWQLKGLQEQDRKLTAKESYSFVATVEVMLVSLRGASKSLFQKPHSYNKGDMLISLFFLTPRAAKE